MFNGNGPSLADIAAVTNNDGGFGGNNGWWVLIILFAIFGGWGNGGYPMNGGGGQGAYDNYVLASDFATLQRQIDSATGSIENKLDSVNNGICSLGYDQLAQMNGINQNISNTGYNMLSAVQQDTVANMQNTNNLTSQITALGTQLQQCCCDNKALIADLKYTMAQDNCNVMNAIQQATQSIILNDNANYRALHDENVQLQMAAKDETIADLRSRLNYRDINDSNNAQTAYLLSQLKGNPCGCLAA